MAAQAQVAALIVEPELRVRVREALRSHGAAHFCERAGELLALLARQSVDVVITEPSDSSGVSLVSTLRAIRASHPFVPVFVYCPWVPAAIREMVQLARADIDGVLLQGTDDTREGLEEALEQARAARMMLAASGRRAPLAGKDFQTFLAHCLRQGERVRTVTELAATLGVSRRTLVNRMAAAGMPAPRTVIAWCRLLLAARLLEEPERSVDEVARRLGFTSGEALRKLFLRHAGIPPTDVRRRGGTRRLLALLWRELERRTKPESSA